MPRAPPSPSPLIEPGTRGFLSVGDPAQGPMSLHEAQVSETPCSSGAGGVSAAVVEERESTWWLQ